MLAEKNPYIESAYQHLQVISQDKQKRLEYEVSRNEKRGKVTNRTNSHTSYRVCE